MNRKDILPMRAGANRLQTGMSLMERLVAAVCSILIVGISGRFFLANLRGYMEIKKTVAMQVSLKKTLQVMTRQISNAGGWMPNPRSHFQAQSGRIRFAYFDVEAKYCPVPDTLVVGFYVRQASKGGEIVEEHTCGGGAPRLRTIAEAPKGGNLNLRFSYLNADGAPTSNPAMVKAVDVAITLNSGKLGSQPQAKRAQSLQVKMVNL